MGDYNLQLDIFHKQILLYILVEIMIKPFATQRDGSQSLIYSLNTFQFSKTKLKP